MKLRRSDSELSPEQVEQTCRSMERIDREVQALEARRERARRLEDPTRRAVLERMRELADIYPGFMSLPARVIGWLTRLSLRRRPLEIEGVTDG